MKKFLAMYMAPVAAMERMMKEITPEVSKQHNEAWATWMNSKKASIVDPGAPLGKTKRVTTAGVSNVRNDMGGYTIVEAPTAEEAAALFTDNPMIAGMPEAYVDVVEIMPMPM